MLLKETVSPNQNSTLSSMSTKKIPHFKEKQSSSSTSASFNVKFVESSAMDHINTMLQGLDVGDRVVRGRTAVFLCHHMSHDEKKHEVNFETSSTPVQRMKEILATLVATMNESFSDYDFSTLEPSNFVEECDINRVVNGINHNLAIVVERLYPGFIHDLWKGIRECIDLRHTRLFSLSLGDSDPFSSLLNPLWSFDYFFYDGLNHKIVFLACCVENHYKDGDTTPVNNRIFRIHSSQSPFAYAHCDDGDISGHVVSGDAPRSVNNSDDTATPKNMQTSINVSSGSNNLWPKEFEDKGDLLDDLMSECSECDSDDDPLSVYETLKECEPKYEYPCGLLPPLIPSEYMLEAMCAASFSHQNVYDTSCVSEYEDADLWEN